MLVHLLAHAVKHAQASVTGRRLKSVVCEKCQTQYWYFLSRNGAGKASYFILADSSTAVARAQKSAGKNLEKRLDREAEPVPCPACHWINEDLVTQARRRKYRRAPVAAIVLLFVGAVTFPIAVAIADSSRDRSATEPMVLAAEVSAPSVVTAIAIFPIRALLRRRINPNRRFPLPPELIPGTPPAMVRAKDLPLLQLADVQYASAAKYDGWAILRPGQLVFPKVCCLCLAETALIYRPWLRINENSAGLPVPFCNECKRNFRGIWLVTALLTILGAAAIGAAVVAIPGLDEVGRWISGSVVALFGSIIGLFVIPNRICRPYRFAIIDRDRGIMKFAAKNEDYTRLVNEQARRFDNGLASEAKPERW